MKMLKKTLAFFLALAMLLCIAPMPASAAVETGGTLYGDDGPYTAPCVEDGYFVVTPNVGSAWHDYGGSGVGGCEVVLLGGEYDGRIYFTVTGEADITIKACSHIYNTTTELALEELNEGIVANYEFADVYTFDGEWDSSQWEVIWEISDLGPGVYYLDGVSDDPVAISRIDVSETTDTPHTHSLEEVMDLAPTCTQAGHGRIVCSCGIVAQTISYPVLEHDYEATGTVAPTCTAQGYTSYTCYVCGKTIRDNYVAELGHNYDADGICIVCGKHDPSTCEHSYSAVVTPPTCVEKGYTTYTCANCGNCYKDNYVTALTYGEYTYRFDAYEELYGDSELPNNVGTEGFFSVSGIHADDSAAYNQGYVVLDPEGTRTIEFTIPQASYATVTFVVSCPTDGEGLLHIDGSDYNVYGTDGETEITLNLSDVYNFTVDVCACLDDGQYGEVRVHSILVDVHGVGDHTYETAVKEPTCTEAGGTVHTCTVCGDSYMTDEVAALGHSYSSVVTAPTCSKQGFTTYTCTVCGDSYVADYVDALGHNYVDGICTGCGRHQCAVDTTYTFNALDLTAAADNEVIPAGSYVGTNDYFLVEGKITKRISSNTVKYVELLKNEGGKFTFQITGVANVTINACSTSKTNTSVIALVDANGNIISSDQGSIVEVTGTGGTNVTYADLPAGTYSIISPTENVYKRNTRVIRIDVVESGPSVAHSYESVTVDATCTENGSTIYTCSVCGDSYSESIEAKGHSFENGSCGICGAADPDYVAPEAPKPGLQKGEDGNYYYYVDGEIATGFTGLVENAAGRWYIENGKAMLNYDGMIEFEGTKYLIKGGRVNTSFSGISKQEGVYYYFGAGVNDLEFEGLVLCNGMKAYVQDGEVNFNKTGVVEDNGQLLYVKYGIWRNTFKGLARTDDGQWIYMVNGAFDATYTGVAKLNANWVYVENGYVSNSFSGTVTVNGVDYTVKYGVVQF